MGSDSRSYAFEVHPSVIFKLGQELITDDYQALSELAKNSYDADARRADISINTKCWYGWKDGNIVELPQPIEGALLGMIEIADNGDGMTESDIVHGWLTISASKKRDMKAHGQKTSEGRTPLGDKGLGRLGAQRLGAVLEMSTKTQDGLPLSVVIDWSRFKSNASLSQIPIDVNSAPDFPRKKGTTLRIYGLYNCEQWDDHSALQGHFANIISPYSDEIGFKVILRVNNELVDLRKQSALILKNALLSYALKYQERRLNVSGIISIRYLADLRNSKRRREWERFIQPDDGRGYYDWLMRKKGESLASYSAEFGEDADVFCTTKFFIALDDLDRVSSDESGRALDPGAFDGRIDYVARNARSGDYPDVTALKEYIDSIKGVKVYRDGFGVPVEEIIPFGSQWTSGRSWYLLRPDNTIGYLNISAEHNAQLIETTNREAFAENGYSRNLQHLLAAWLNEAGRVQELIRRSYSSYIEECIKRADGLDEGSSASDLAKKAKKDIDAILKSEDKTNIRKQDPRVTQAAKRGKAAVDALFRQVDTAEANLDDAWELAGLGIIAETVSHETTNVANRVIREAKVIQSCNTSRYGDAEIDASTIAIMSLANALVKQVSHLDSSLKYVRNRKDRFSVKTFAEDTAEYARPRLSSKEITVSVIGEDFAVRMNQGRLAQALDNLINNSEYWLTGAKERAMAENPAITIEIRRPFLYVSDNGKGVHESVTYSLFDPFVTRKGNGQGRGLGLYISRRLLEAEGCRITLEGDRNEYGRRYKFKIDLAAVEV